MKERRVMSFDPERFRIRWKIFSLSPRCGGYGSLEVRKRIFIFGTMSGATS
jgi:hypothetical protein